MVAAAFEMAKTAFEIALGLTGMMCLWLGIMKLGEQRRRGRDPGAARRAAPAPALPRRAGGPSGDGRDGDEHVGQHARARQRRHAARPQGDEGAADASIPEPERATDAQVLFLVINTASITLIPVAIFVYRAQMGAADPTDIFIPLLIASFFATLVGLVVTSFFQPIRAAAIRSCSPTSAA